MASDDALWRTYEEVADFLLDKIAVELGLDRVEGKQRLGGDVGTPWEVDGKGVKLGDGGLVVIECKRYPSRKVSQGVVGELAYKIRDLGASGGILVSPLGIQEGGLLIAAAENIVEVHLNPGCTPYEYMLSFLNRTFVGATDSITSTEHASVTVVKNSDD